jgi:TonB-linked SusC/RagA family outer membrane protein
VTEPSSCFTEQQIRASEVLKIIKPKKLHMRNLLFLFLFLVACSAIAQSQTVTGKVTNAKGEAVSFATVKVKGSKTSVAADVDGFFKIPAVQGQVLVISATNYAATEVPVNTSSLLAVTLKIQEASLSEVVVTALGQSQNKAKLGYSTASFTTSTINKNAAVGMLDGLEGKVAGADISNVGGPGSSTKVVLRGYGVIAGGNNQPLYVVDGVPLSDGQFQNNTGGTDAVDFGNGMNNINPNDIESITILKGTAASSLYGGLAKNGVIMITTKKGRAGQLRIEYSGSANFSKVGKLPDYQTEFGQGWGGIFVSDENGSWGPKLDGKERLWGSVVDNSQLEKPFSYINNNLRNFFSTGSEYNNSISLSGGNEVSRFYFSYGNVTSNGIIPYNANSMARNTISLRSNNSFGKFSLNASINYVNQRLNAPSSGYGSASGGGVFNSLIQIPVDVPITDFKDINNKFFNESNYFTPYAENPYFSLENNGDKQTLDRIFGNFDLSYKFTSHLNAEFRLGGDFTNARTFIWKQPAAAAPGTWDGSPATNPEGAPRNPDIGEVAQGSDYSGVINGDFILKYNKDLSKDFTLDVLAGANYYQNSARSEGTAVTNLVVPGFYNLSNTSKPPVTSDQSFEKRRMGIYGQATLAFRDQLYLTGNIRNDWSSTLPINANSIFYPGANLSWVASQLINSRSILSFLKFRAAYGRTGSDPDPYLVLPQLGPGTITFTQIAGAQLNFPFNGVSGFGINNTIGNLNLKPIFTNEFEFGTEARFFNDRIGFDVTLYDKTTVGQIFTVPIAPSTGYGFIVENLGTVDNKGIELTMNLRAIESKNFNWNINYVFSRNINTVEHLTGASQDPLLNAAFETDLRAVVGKSVASIYTVVPQQSPTGQVVVNPVTGMPLPNTTPLDNNGLTKAYMGSGLYDFTMGLTNTFAYKNFALNFTLDLRYGGVMYSETANILLFDGNGAATTYNDRRPFIIPNSVVSTTDGSGKTIYVPNTTFIGSTNIKPGGTLNETDQNYNYYGEGSSFTGGSDAMRIIDRSFLKLRDINLSYTLPTSLASTVKAKSASLGIYARNILLWTPKSNMYVDPEATNLGNDLAGQLGEFEATPLAKSYGIILKVAF